MSDQRYSPAEIELELPFGTFLFRLPPPRIARLQETCGFKVEFPDRSVGVRPKALGTITREHMAGIGGELPNLDADSYFAEYDAADSREVIIQGLIGGARGIVDGQMVIVNDATARGLVIEHVDTWPTIEKWKLATAILIACTQGFRPPAVVDEDDDEDDGVAPPGNVDAVSGNQTTSSTSQTPPET